MAKRKKSAEYIKILADKKSKFEKCELCDKRAPEELHHIIPVSLGGSDDERNLIYICRVCHSLLTPKSELIKIAKERKSFKHKASLKFWETVERRLKDGEDTIDAVFGSFQDVLGEISEVDQK